MERPIKPPQLPLPQVSDFYPTSAGPSGRFGVAVSGQPPNRGQSPGRGYDWAQSMYSTLNSWFKDFLDSWNTGTQVQNIVPTLASAATINITAYMTHITGVAAISNIVVEKDFGGVIVLIADDAWTLVAGGNIARPAAPGLSQAVFLAYDHTKGLWYSSI